MLNAALDQTPFTSILDTSFAFQWKDLPSNVSKIQAGARVT